MCERAAAFGQAMRWPAVAREYRATFERCRREHAELRRVSFQAATLAERPGDLPELDLSHLRTLTDETGLLQHAQFNVPRYADGYCLDDNARALLLCAALDEAGHEDARGVRSLAARYLAFVCHAYNHERGRFRNLMTFTRHWSEEVGSEDSHGRALWALGAVVSRSRDPGRQRLANELFHAALPAVARFTSPRAWAFTLLGLDEYLRALSGEREADDARRALAERLHAQYRAASKPGWPWFEDRVTYCNARLSHALIASGDRLARADFREAGLRSLEWLLTIQRSPEGFFAPVGSNGWYVRGGEMASYDQQPVEAAGVVAACLEAQRVTGEARWTEQADRAFAWYLGQNELQRPLYDPTTGGCRDGLHADRPNENQGAESTLSFLLALLEMRSVRRGRISQVAAPQETAALEVVAHPGVAPRAVAQEGP